MVASAQWLLFICVASFSIVFAKHRDDTERASLSPTTFVPDMPSELTELVGPTTFIGNAPNDPKAEQEHAQ